VSVSPPIAFALVAGALILAGLALAARRPDLVVRHARAVLGLAGLVSAAALAALVQLDPPGLRLRIDPSTEPMLPRSDPAKDEYREAVRDFGDDEVFVIAMETADVFTAENLAALRHVGDLLSRLPEVREVRSLARVTSFRWVPADEWIEIGPLIQAIPSQPAELAALRTRVLADPLLLRILVSADGRTAALNVSFRELTDREFIAADIDGRIQRILDGEARDGIRFHVAGRPHVKSRVYHLVLRDLSLLLPLAVAGIAAVLTLCLGSWRGVVLPLASVLLATLWTFAAVAFLDRPLTILTVILAPTLITIGSVYGVHVITRWEEEAALAPDPPTAACRCLEHVRTPALISGLTTVVGFGALLVTDVPAVFELGAFSVLGIACVTLLSVTAVPAALALLPLEKRDRAGASALARTSARIRAAFEAWLSALNRASARHSGGVIVAWALLSLLALWLVPRVRVDTDYLSYFHESSKVRRDFEAVNRLLAGAVPIFVVVDGEAPGAFREPEALRQLERLSREVERLPGVTHTASIADLLRALNRAIEADDPTKERIPDTRAGVAELLQFVPKNDTRRLLTTDHARANLVVRTGAVGSEAVEALAAGIEQTAAAVLPDGLRSRVTGNAILLSRSADGIATGQLQSVCLAAGSIFLLILAGLRSLPLAVIAMIPNVVPVLLFFGMLGAGLAPLSLPTSLIGSVALGIAIDDTVHYIARYRTERMAGLRPDEASRRTSQSVGAAIVIACAMLVAGYSIIALSGFATLRQFGLLSAGTMLLCLVTDLILLPALLVRWRA
jgi:hydrophobe/amphiphile efflux-3 (HAE3) family protein